VCVYLALGGVELHERDGLQCVHLQVVRVLAERCFHHSVAEHMSPLEALVRCALALQAA
jgi:hypothetical protein